MKRVSLCGPFSFFSRFTQCAPDATNSRDVSARSIALLVETHTREDSVLRGLGGLSFTHQVILLPLQSLLH